MDVVLIAAAIACLPILITGFRIERWEGGVFLFCFVAYDGYVWVDASGHDALPPFSFIMWLFVFPLTMITLVLMARRAFRSPANDRMQ